MSALGRTSHLATNLSQLYYSHVPPGARTPQAIELLSNVTQDHMHIGEGIQERREGGPFPRKSIEEQRSETEETERICSTLAQWEFSEGINEAIQQSSDLILRIRHITNLLLYKLYYVASETIFNNDDSISRERYVLNRAGTRPKENFNDNPNPTRYEHAKKQLLGMSADALANNRGAAQIKALISSHYDNSEFRKQKARDYLEMLLKGSPEEREVFCEKDNQEYWLLRMCGQELNILWKEGYDQLFYEKQKLIARQLYAFGCYLKDWKRLNVFRRFQRNWEEMACTTKIQKALPSLAIAFTAVGSMYAFFSLARMHN